MLKPKDKQILCTWCGHKKSIKKELEKAYQQGKADAIDEYVSILKKDLEFTEKYGDLVVKLAEQMKEQKNDTSD